MSSKCLDLHYFELFSDTLLGSKFFKKDIQVDFSSDDSDPIVILGY